MMASSVVAGVKRSFTAMATDQRDSSSQRLFAQAADSSAKRRQPSQRLLRTDRLGSVDSASRSTSNSPRAKTAAGTPNDGNTSTRFSSDASIVLVGMRGTGKSTLAIIASTAMKRRIIDTENAFLDATGLSTTAFKKTHGNIEYQRRQYGILQGILNQYARDCIIVSSWVERAVQNLLEAFSAHHPVIHVIRDQKATADYLGVTDVDKLRELLDYSASTFRACGNFEFFNVSEELPKPGDATMIEVAALYAHGEQKSPAPYLTLKRAERHFLKFLSLILPKGTIPYIESAFPLASILTEKRQFTYAMSVPLSKLLSDGIKIEDLETGADAIEIVVDDAFSQAGQNGHLSPDRASQISRVVGHIRRNVVIPIIYHVVWPSPSLGSIDNTQKLTYIEHIQHGLRLAPEYIGLDLRLEDELFSQVVDAKMSTKVIGTVNMAISPAPSWKDPLWVSYYQRARNLRCDLVRMLRPAAQIEDNFEINSLRQAVEDLAHEYPALPLIAFNTGQIGRHSQCFNKILTSVAPESSAPGGPVNSSNSLYIQPAITAVEATSTLHSSFINDAMKLYVFGANVGYSMSPAMHNTALKACGILHVYRPYSTDSLTNIRDLIHDPLFAGASIGLPFKVEVISLTHSLSSHAKAIGAVNTLIPVRHLNSDGSIPENALFFNFRNRAGPVLALYGENTDWIGIRACIRRGLSPANAVRSSSSGLVVGAGGMARAAVYAMLQLGVKNIAIFNRTRANAEKLVAHFTKLLSRDDLPLLSASSEAETTFHIIRAREEPWPTKFRHPTMIISCIPTHKIRDCPAPNFTLPSAWMESPTGGVVVELAYKYLNTPLLEQVRAEAHRGWVPMDGLDLLPEQGYAQFELFTGRRAPRRLMRAEVFTAYPDEHGESNQTQLQPRLENIVEQEP